MNKSPGVAAPGNKAAPAKDKETKQFKSKAPKAGQKGSSDIPGLGADAAFVCPWETYGDLELSDLAQFGIV